MIFAVNLLVRSCDGNQLYTIASKSIGQFDLEDHFDNEQNQQIEHIVD